MICLILSSANYKDNDCIINAFSLENGFFSFKARGCQKNTTSSSKIKTPLTFFEVSFLDNLTNTERLVLKSCKVYKYFNADLFNDSSLVNFNIVLDLLLFLKENGDYESTKSAKLIFNLLLEENSKALKQNIVSKILLIMLKNINPLLNFENVKEFTSISLETGLTDSLGAYSLTKEEVKCLLSIENNEIESTIFKTLCFKIMTFIEDTQGYKFNSLILF